MPVAHDQRPVAQTSDQQTLRLRANVGSTTEFAFRTDPGLHSPDEFRAAELCLLDVLHDADPDRLLVIDANYGVLGIVPASFGAHVTMIEHSARAAARCRGNARHNEIADRVSVELRDTPPTSAGPFDIACLAPRAYVPNVVVEQRMADAIRSLDPGGRFYLAAAPHAGLAAFEETLAALCGAVTRGSERDDQVVLEATRPAAYDAPTFVSPQVLRPTINGVSLTQVTRPGLFSAAKLDAGTRALAEHLELGTADRVLDLACGYGPLGVYTARVTGGPVTMTDDEYVATTCARESAARSGVDDRVTVVTANGVDGVTDREFDRVLCNPPTHAGAEVLHELMGGARDVLTDGGTVHLVHHAGIDFDRYLDPQFDRISGERVGAYRVVEATG